MIGSSIVVILLWMAASKKIVTEFRLLILRVKMASLPAMETWLCYFVMFFLFLPVCSVLFYLYSPFLKYN
jgi:hypothetical protein